MNRRAFVVAGAVSACALALGLAVPAARAGKPATYTGLVRGVAAGGYDVVAYFAGTPIEGSGEFTSEHNGATYRFASAANRDAFTANPARYAPQYGGYCAWAVANGYTAKGDPVAWSVEGGKLYLNYSKSVRSDWLKDVSGNIAKGDANWPKVLE
jgi:YHS domain-containing protein